MSRFDVIPARMWRYFSPAVRALSRDLSRVEVGENTSPIDFIAAYEGGATTTDREVAYPLGWFVMPAAGTPPDPGRGAVVLSPNPSPCVVPSELEGPRIRIAAGTDPEPLLNGQSLEPGTVVEFERGGVWGNVRLRVTGTGTAEAPVLVCSYGNWEDPAPTFRALKPGSFKDDGILAVLGTNVHVRDLKFETSGSIAVNVYPSAAGAVMHNIEVFDCVHGFWVRANGTRVWNCWVHDGRMMPDTPGPLDDYGAAGVTVEAADVVVEGLTGHRLSAYSPDYVQWGPDGAYCEVWMEGSRLIVRYGYAETTPRIVETGGLGGGNSAVDMRIHGIYARDVTDAPFYDNPDGPYAGVDVTGKRVFDLIVNGAPVNVP